MMKEWGAAQVTEVLNVAQQALVDGARRLGIEDETMLVRKARAVGVHFTGAKRRSTAFFLDELALLARAAVQGVQAGRPRQLPFCTFNGGSDVFVDIGSKEIGIDVLRSLVGAERAETLHVGDQFTRTGNDLLARRACGTLWVDDPAETAVVLRELLSEMDARKS
mmetsp:Transcript_168255/g.540559  ORF Transcript_168255/g.540559 Transcript_168255/m.540559 type:complete len:165 (-) Transcript_168255:123-617(-)